ncbi:MAG: hypothetical protein CMG24_01690 [Candidatus Marinimicrobia bacterium]|nr:hypothetical protein [Candidatus Neomarinimicrobiota bacterium]
MIAKNYKLIPLINIFVFLFNSCNLYKKNLNNDSIIKNRWSGDAVLFSDVSSQILKQKYINRGWTKFNKNNSIPYFRLKKQEGIILGNYYEPQKEYLVVQLDNGKKYKWEKSYWQINDNALPGHLCRIKDLDEAKKLNGKYIWLNFIANDTSFINISGLIYNKFQKVKIIDTKVYQNGGKDWPIWLVIESNNEFNAMVRYNGDKKFVRKQNYYFDNPPLPRVWGEDLILKIISGEVLPGMTDEQVRVAVGNPDFINNTSSRHSVSEQWIYGSVVGQKMYLSFDYGKLVSMSK